MFKADALGEIPRFGVVWPSGRKLLLAVAFCGTLIALFMAVAASGSLDTVIQRELELRRWIDGHPFPAFVVGLAIYTAVSFVPGTSGKAVVAGWLYGFWCGVLLVEIGLTIAALVGFLLSRYLLRDFIRSRYTGYIVRLDTILKRRPYTYLLSLRLAHFPFTFLNYALGPTPVATRTFLLTTAAGLLPGTAVFVFAGCRLPTLQELTEQGAWRLVDPWLIAALVLTASALPLVHLTLTIWNRHVAKSPKHLKQAGH